MSGPGPIGVFDSGLGGLTVVRAVLRELPGLDLIYFGDTARIPYGTKSPDTVVRYACEIADVLLAEGAQVLVVACNTASAVALDALVAHVSVPVMGVLEPGAQAAARATRSRRIAVLGTPATVGSGAYERAVLACDPRITVQQIACPLFVPLVEEQWLTGPVPEQVVDHYLAALDPLTDTIILGCTHYPLLKPVLQARIGPDVVLIDSADATAAALRQLLAPDGWCPPAQPGHIRALTSDAPEAFGRAGAAFLGEAIPTVEWHRL